MPRPRDFESQLAALEGLREQTPEVQLKELKVALSQRNNYLVARAADLVREFHLTALAPDLIAAYDKFFQNAPKTDPQCWAKNALSRCLATLELGSLELFLCGFRFRQLEPVWGGQSDTATTLRATCALALVACSDLPGQRLLTLLIDELPENNSDEDMPVRIAIFRAMEKIGSPPASLLLRLRALLGEDKPEVLGVCFSGVLSIEGSSAIDFVARFLTPDDVGAEAALAIGAMRSLSAFQKLKECLEGVFDIWFRGVLFSAIALTRQDEALEFLLEGIGRESLQAEAIVTAVVESLPNQEWMTRLEKLVSPNPRLLRVFQECRQNAI